MNADIKNRVRYECVRCGNCCRWEGIVRLTAAEVEAIAAYLGMDPDDFVRTYTHLAPDRRGLKLIDTAAGHCIMLTADGLCRINPVKPVQCSGFPNTWRVPDLETHCSARKIEG